MGLLNIDIAAKHVRNYEKKKLESIFKSRSSVDMD
jgi:hypothetical protein